MPKTNEELNAEIFKDMTRDRCSASADLNDGPSSHGKPAMRPIGTAAWPPI